jgi:hypothetical protein
VESPHAEYLTYAIEPEENHGAVVSLAWEKRRLSFRVELAKP